ncbi:hypothetical protein WA1_39185 [Scytonema hofmannii PCC 7110]|uniref:Uncharacterized protein n=1 Tax=Scytonema hofmannii PCC 7110 TaxID=128403 RepID=A0A139X0X4_9CYAN|nr:hypothetical protein [Scytonema hofmannii]KYC38355.1 hypothetical protein WA1_39185 [Scytonema hofmannii PCC 7110]
MVNFLGEDSDREAQAAQACLSQATRVFLFPVVVSRATVYSHLINSKPLHSMSAVSQQLFFAHYFMIFSPTRSQFFLQRT